jgi:hypothetical protein
MQTIEGKGTNVPYGSYHSVTVPTIGLLFFLRVLFPKCFVCPRLLI